MKPRNHGWLLALLALPGLLAACGRQEAAQPAPDTDAEDAAASVAPAILPPNESADPAEPPSYEVSIASAAADHNKALERCAQQPEAVRTQCEQEANASFADVRSSLESLRGNQP
jgi:hypothetical protein